MPGARTYQAIGYAAYHGGKFVGRHKRAEAQREAEYARKRHQTKVTGLVIAAVVASVAVRAARRASKPPTV
jgi:hypothetical protein